MGNKSSKKKTVGYEIEKQLFNQFTEESKRSIKEVTSLKFQHGSVFIKPIMSSRTYCGIEKNITHKGLMSYYLTSKPHLVVQLDSPKAIENANYI